jgi:cation/acetate symporter
MAGLSFEPRAAVSNKEANAAFKKQLNKVYGWYTGGFWPSWSCWPSPSRWA